MTNRFVVRRAAEAEYLEPGALAPGSHGLTRWRGVGYDDGAVHSDFGVSRLAAGGVVPAHVHSFEEAFHMLEGEVVLATPEATVHLVAGDYGVIPVGVPHSWRAMPGDADGPRPGPTCMPRPRARSTASTRTESPSSAVARARSVSPRGNPRTRSFGAITTEHLDKTRQSQELLAQSASMRTALLVYSGISLKMMVDSDLGATLASMFMVQYQPDGKAGPHDHPLEEVYLILDGEVDATFDGEQFRLGPGDIAWAQAGCVHSFAAVGAPVRWLETQSPQMPARHAYRFRPRLGLSCSTTRREAAMSERTVVVIGGTSGICLEIAKDIVARGDRVVISVRDLDRTRKVADSLGDAATAVVLELSEPESIAPGPRSRSARCMASSWGAIDRDANTIRDYDLGRAMRLVTLKLIGYTEVVHALLDRLVPSNETGIVLFGGRAKDAPYPGSTTVSTINGGIEGLLDTLALELAPIRVNALHPGIVGDSPFWASKPAGVLEHKMSRTPGGRARNHGRHRRGGDVPAHRTRRLGREPERRSRLAAYLRGPSRRRREPRRAT